MYYVYIDTSEVHYSFVMKVYVFCPAQMVGVLYIYIYNGENFKCAKAHGRPIYLHKVLRDFSRNSCRISR